MYKYEPDLQVASKIVHVKAEATMAGTDEDNAKLHRVAWFVEVREKFIPITEDILSDCVAGNITELKVRLVEHFHRKKLPYQQEFTMTFNIEKIFETAYYVDSKTFQICSIKWDPTQEKWFGLHRKKADIHSAARKIVEITKEWAISAFGKDYVQKMFELGEQGQKKFHAVPLGDTREITPSMDISNNPKVAFHQTESTCVFSSFASALHYLSWVEEAEAIMNFCKVFYDTMAGHSNKALQALVQHIQENKIFKKFRSKYTQKKKVKSTFDLLQPVSEGCICLVNILGSDGSTNHAVTIVTNYIFDSNLHNALPHTREGLDDCAGEDCTVIGAIQGYLFVKVSSK
jgi:hypothetical protein